MAFYNRQEKGRPIAIYDDGVLLTSNAGSIDFAGAGVSGSVVGSAITETISGTLGTPVYNEVLTGTGTSFTLAHTPNPTGSLILWKNGQGLSVGEDFILSGAGITLSIAKTTNDYLIAKQYVY